MRVRLSAPASPQLVRKNFSIAPTAPTVVNASPQVNAVQRSPGDSEGHARRFSLQRDLTDLTSAARRILLFVDVEVADGDRQGWLTVRVRRSGSA
jgi:hypothetical protein